MALKHFKIKNGDWPSAAGAPAQSIEGKITAQSAAFLGSDAPKLRPKFEVAEGDSVNIGQVIFRDRKHPEIAYVAPMSGTIAEIAYGPRRTLSACVIQHDPSEQGPPAAGPLDHTTPASVRSQLLSRGMWPAFVTRPFGQTPSPDARPDAIFVNATQGAPYMPDPHVVLDGQIDALRLGVSLLVMLTEGAVYVAQSRGDPLCPSLDGVETAGFSGTIAAGFVGTHIDRLHPVGSVGKVWSIGYQDVAAIGHLFQTGQYSADRVVAFSGSAVARPGLVRTCLGANITNVISGEDINQDNDSPTRFFSGDLATERDSVFLGRFHQRITVNHKTMPSPAPAWFARLFPAQNALIPTAALDRALAIDVLAVPLMRALSVGDTEAAMRLGCMSLAQEDVAILSRLCTSGADYGDLLQQVLDDLMDDAA